MPIEVALDFVNTLEHSRDHGHGAPARVATLSSRGWLGTGSSTTPERVDEARRFAAMPSEGKNALADARSLRRALRRVVDARVQATAARPRDIAVREPLAAGPACGPTRRDPHGLEPRRAPAGTDPLKRALGHLADAGARAVASEDPDRLRTCANEECRWAFYDTSRGGRRKWCDMASCGNRRRRGATASVAVPTDPEREEHRERPDARCGHIQAPISVIREPRVYANDAMRVAA